MTGSETLSAACDALRNAANPPAHYGPLADWLNATSMELRQRSKIWERTGQDVDGLTGVLFRWPLKVAHAVLSEVRP